MAQFPNRSGVGEFLGQVLLCMYCWPLRKPAPLYPVANYTPHLLSESLYGKCYFCDPIYPCAAGLSEYVPYYSLFCGQLYTPSAKLVTLPEM